MKTNRRQSIQFSPNLLFREAFQHPDDFFFRLQQCMRHGLQ
jgi:hypothetical protein